MKASRSMAWMGTQHALRLIVGLLTAVVLARYLGPALYGDYQSVISWVLIFNALAAAGLQSVVIQNLATQNQPGRVLGSALRIRIFFTGFSLLFCITLPLLLGMHSNLWYGVILMSPLLIAQNGDLIEYFYIAQANPRPAVLMRLIGLLTVVFLFVWGLLTQQSWYFFLMAFVAEHIVAAVGLLVINQYHGLRLKNWRFDLSMAVELWGQAWPIMISTVFYLAAMRLDVLLLNLLSTPWQTGNYAAAARFAQLWAFIPLVIVNATFPALARLSLKNPPVYVEKLKALLNFLALGGWIIALPLSLSASWLVPLLLGADFSATAPLLQMQAWITLAYFVRVGMDRWLVQEKLTRYNMLFQIFTVILNLSLNFCLIPRWGAWGATISSLVALASGVMIFPLFFKATRSFALSHVLPAFIAPIWVLIPQKRQQIKEIFKL